MAPSLIYDGMFGVIKYSRAVASAILGDVDIGTHIGVFTSILCNFSVNYLNILSPEPDVSPPKLTPVGDKLL